MLPIIFILPLMQLVILSNAASFEVKNIKFSYIDHDHSSTSRELISKFGASNYFNIISEFPSKKEANLQMQKGNVDVILENPIHFERNLLKQKNPDKIGIFIKMKLIINYCLITLIDFTESPTITFTMYVPALN